MPRRLLIVLLTVLTLTLTLSRPVRADLAKDLLKGAASGGGSWAAEFALNALAGGLYTGECNKGQVTDPGGDLLCSVAGGISGKDEEKWRGEVDAKLEALQGQLEEVRRGQKQIEDALSRQGEALKRTLDNLPSKLRVHDDLANIQNGWSAYTEFFRDMDPKTPAATQQAIHALAKDLLSNDRYNVEASARDLRIAIVEGPAGNPPLPMLLAREIDAWNRNAHRKGAFEYLYPQDLDIRSYYADLELAMQEWMLRQKQAQVMYLWAARALEGTADAPRATAREYGKSYFRSIQQQLDSFQRAVEWLVLASSLPRSPYPDFLPKGAAEVFARADAIEALQLSAPAGVEGSPSGQGLWGRVISMGASFDGKLKVAGPGQPARAWGPAKTVQQPLQGYPSLDWWSASNPDQPLTFDTIHFGKAWTVYRYRLPLGTGSRLGTYTISSAGARLPFLTERVTVENSLREITGGTDLYFGSVLGIARAGGAYALFSGEFVGGTLNKLGVAEEYSEEIRWDAGPQITKTRVGTMVRVAVVEQGTARTKYENAHAGLGEVPYAVDRIARIHRRSEKLVRSPDVGSLKLHVLWNEDPLGAGAIGAEGKELVLMHNNWNSPTMNLFEKAFYKVRVGVTLGDWSKEANGFTLARTYDKQAKPRQDHATREKWQEDVMPVTLPPGGAFLDIGAEVHITLPKSGAERTWKMLAKTSFQTVYLSDR